MADNFADVLDSVLDTVEAISNLEYKRKKLTDMLLDDIISKDAYDEKYDEFTAKITKAKQECECFLVNVNDQQNIGKRMRLLREGGI